jgi:hypothetical protein
MWYGDENMMLNEVKRYNVYYIFLVCILWYGVMLRNEMKCDVI